MDTQGSFVDIGLVCGYTVYNECKRQLYRALLWICITTSTLGPISVHTVDAITHSVDVVLREVGGWGRDPKKCTGSIWGMGSSTI